MKKKVIIAAIIILGATFLIWQSNRQKDQKISSVKVKRGDLKQTLTLSGSVEASEKVVLTFQTAGRLSHVGVKEGDTISKGQLVASLDQQSVRKNLQKELNDFLKERNDLDQARDDYKSVVITDTIKRLLENAQYDVNNTVLDVEIQNIAVQYSSLNSPIDGIVTHANPKHAGINVTATSASYEIINPDSVYFAAPVDQSEVGQLGPGINSTVIVDPFPEEEVTAIVDSISFVPKAGETGTVYEVKLILPVSPASLKYRIGMTGDVKFVTERVTGALYIPIGYLQEDEKGNAFVYLMENGKKAKRPVKTGIETDEFTEIIEGLSEGDTVYD